jgi:hypothetical protein
MGCAGGLRGSRKPIRKLSKCDTINDTLQITTTFSQSPAIMSGAGYDVVVDVDEEVKLYHLQ